MSILKIFKLVRVLINFGIIFWLLETTFFLIKDGWHTKAISVAEKNCDKIVSLSFNIATFFFIFVIYHLVKSLLEIAEKENIEEKKEVL